MLSIINKKKTEYLLSLPYIKQAIALEYGQFSCAFIVLSWHGQNTNLQALEEDIQSELICLDTLPLNAQGEVDSAHLMHSVYAENLSSIKQKIAAAHIPLNRFLLSRKWLRPYSIPSTSTYLHDESNETNEQKSGLPAAIVHGEPNNLPITSPLTLLDAFTQTLQHFPDKYLLCINASKQEKKLTYQELFHNAQLISQYLHTQSLQIGENIILAFDDYYPLFQCLWGSIYHGNPFVTVFLNYAYDAINAASEKFHNTWQLLEKPFILTSKFNQSYFKQLSALYPHSDFQILFYEEAFSQPDKVTIPPEKQTTPSSTLFYQLTSGSTGLPKCIIETHHNVMQHILHSAQFNAYSDQDTSLNWIMFDHVVPLITYHFRDIVLGCNQIHVSTEVIINQPIQWLEYIEKYQVTLTWAPNFGYQLLLDAVNQYSEHIPNFNCIRYFMNAGEQVTPNVMRALAVFLQKQRIPVQTIQPAFGMAEVATCMTYNNHFHPESSIVNFKKSSIYSEFVDLGSPISGCSIRIVDKNQTVLPESVIGELQIKGTILSAGYYNNASANAAFHKDGWLSTGDLGFIQHARLYITGREKETIIIRGQNFFCHEIEAVLHGIHGVKSTFCAVTSFFNPTKATEELLVFFVYDATVSNRTDLSKPIRQCIFDNFRLQATYIIDIPEHDFPKTNSGKIQRSLLKQRFLTGDYLWKTPALAAEQAPLHGAMIWVLKKRQDYFHSLAKTMTLLNVILPASEAVRASVRFQNTVQFDYDNQLAFDTFSVCIIPDFYFLNPDDLTLHPDHILKLAKFLDLIAKIETKLDHIVILSKQIFQVTPNECNLGYQQGWLPGFLNSIKKELKLPNIVLMDLEGQNWLDDHKLVELEVQSGCKDDLIVFRQTQRYIQTWCPSTTASLPPLQTDQWFLPGGYYLIVGGTSGIGREIVKHILNRHAIHLIVTGSRHRDAVELQHLFGRHLNRLQYLKFDVETDDLRGILGSYQTKIRGALYLVGTNQSIPIHQMRPDIIEHHVFSKTKGLEKLCAYAHSVPAPPKVMVFSSIFSLLGPAQFSLYAAANSLCDAARDYLAHQYALTVQNIRWCPWNGIGMSKGFDYHALSKYMGFRALNLDACLNIFSELIHSELQNVSVGLPSSAQNIHENDTLYDYFEIQPTTKQRDYPVDTLTQIHQLNLQDQTHKPIKIMFNPTPVSAHLDEDYRDIMHSYLYDIWSKHLKLKSFDSKLHFFALGGDSLTAIQIVMDIRQTFGIVLSVHDFLLCDNLHALLSQLKKQRTKKTKPRKSNKPLSNVYPLSYDQQRLWFQINHNPAETYNVFKVYRVSGSLNTQALYQATEKLLQQFPLLNTQFFAENKQICQTISLYTAQQVFSCIPVSCENTALAHIETLIKKPYGLFANQPLIQLVLYPISPACHIILLQLHHLICDEWSIKLIATHISALYNAQIQGKKVKPHKETLSFYEFSTQQQRCQFKPSKSYLDQITPSYELALPYLHKTEQSVKGHLLTQALSKRTFLKLKHLAKTSRVTPAILLHALYSILLHFYTNQPDLNIGIPITYREDAALKNTFGFLLNLVVIGSQVGHGTIDDHIQQIRRNYFTAHLNKHIPFTEQLSYFNGIARSVETTPLFQAMFVYEDFLNTFSMKKLNFKEIIVSNQTAKFHLNLMVKFPKKDQPVLALEFYTNHLSVQFAKRMLDKMNTLIAYYVDHPNAPIADFFQPDAADLKTIRLINLHRRTIQNWQTLTHMVQKFLTEKTHFTIQYDRQTMSAAMLRQDILKYAHLIKNKKHKRHQVIAICLPSKYQQVVAILATTYLGHPYLPINYEEPIERIKKIITQSTEICLLTDQNKGRVFHPILSSNTIVLDHTNSLMTAPNPMRQYPSLNSRAYIIFTSGTTGQPKGVVIDHQAVLNTIMDMILRFKIQKNDVFLMISSISFDLSVFDLFASLCLQTKLILPDEQRSFSPDYLFDLVSEQAVTIWNSAPGFMRLLINHMKAQSHTKMPIILPHIRKVLLSGDWVSTELVNDIGLFLPNAQIICLGGATEASIWSNYHIADPKHLPPQWLAIPYGRALANQKLYVLNKMHHHCPILVVGQLFIGGLGVAQGYYKNRKLTHSKFITHPKLGRIYDTGDLAKITESGIVELLGRSDEQVKIRGYRIELKEVELAIKALDKFAQVKVLAIGNRDRKQLVAFLIPNTNQTPSYNVAQELKSCLPAPMIPHFFIPLPAFPLTTNGKIDYHQLHQLFEDHRRNQDQVVLDPESDMELHTIQTLFKRILNLKRAVGHAENFFELGGDSIAASYFISEFNTALHYNLSIADLFYAPSPIELRQSISRTTRHTDFSTPPTKQNLPSSPLSANQLRLIFLEHQMDKPSPIHNMTLYYAIRGPLHLEHWLAACQIVFGAHKILNVKMDYDPQGNLQQHHSPHHHVSHNVFDFTSLDSDESEKHTLALQILLTASKKPFDLKKPEKVEMTIVKISDLQFYLLMNTHHLVADGESIKTLFSQLQDVYQQLQSNIVPKLQSDVQKQLDYFDYIQWLTQFEQTPLYEKQVQFWQNKIDSLSNDAGGAPQDNTGFVGKSIFFSIDVTSYQHLKQKIAQHASSGFIYILTLFKFSLYSVLKNSTSIIGTTVSARPKDFESCVGFFANTLPVITHITEQDTLSSLHQKVKKSVLEVLDHQWVSFEKIINMLPKQRTLGHNPLFQIAFVYLKEIILLSGHPDLEVQRLNLHNDTAKFDLTLYVHENPNFLRFEIEYNLNRFTEQFIMGICSNLQSMLNIEQVEGIP